MSDVKICNNCKAIFHKSMSRCTECHSTTFSPTSELNKGFIRWLVSDPDNGQFCRQVGEDEFELKQKIDDEWFYDTILLSDYDDNTINSIVKSNYKDLDEIKELYGSSWSQIVAELIFEYNLVNQ